MESGPVPGFPNRFDILHLDAEEFFEDIGNFAHGEVLLGLRRDDEQEQVSGLHPGLPPGVKADGISQQPEELAVLVQLSLSNPVLHPAVAEDRFVHFGIVEKGLILSPANAAQQDIGVGQAVPGKKGSVQFRQETEGNLVGAKELLSKLPDQWLEIFESLREQAPRLMAWQIETYRRSVRKLPQSAIAERLQVDLDEYRRIEAGNVRITLDLLLRLQVALNAPTEYLWFPFASTIEDASEATVLRALKNACVIFGDERGVER